MKKVVITSVPYTDTTAPIMAPAVLKSIAVKAGHEAYAFDLNAYIHNILVEHPSRLELQEFLWYGKTTDTITKEIHRLFKYMAEEILKHDPDIVCLSLLHDQCRIATRWICYHIKKHSKHIQIVIGGAGIGLLNEPTFIPDLEKNKLIDYYINGDGEQALYELLTGNDRYPGINSAEWLEIEDLDALPYPDYDDYDLSIYRSPFVGVLGSRGCVRQCTFCDVHEYWTKFRWRTAESIFNEMLFQNQKHKTRVFKFQDSLINGNMKQFSELIALLAAHNQNNPTNTISWSSYFIFRPATQMPEEMWSLMAQSGVRNLVVGVESFVEHARVHMKKKFDNDAIEHGLAMARKYKINFVFLMIVGYVTETEDDHQESLQWIRDHRHYANEPLLQMVLGNGLHIIDNTWLDRNRDSLGVKDLDPGKKSIRIYNWEIPATGSTPEVRYRRLVEMARECQDAGFNVTWTHGAIDPQKLVENMLKEQQDKDTFYLGNVPDQVAE